MTHDKWSLNLHDDGESRATVGLQYYPSGRRYMFSWSGYKFEVGAFMTGAQMRQLAAALVKAADHAEMIEYAERMPGKDA